MGITNLKQLIGSVGKTKHLREYRGKTLGIDASIWLYVFGYRDEPNAVHDGLLKQIHKCHRYQITPVYVFDGKASSEIKIALERRQDRRQRVNENIDTLTVELAETLETLGEAEAAAATTIILTEHLDVAGNVIQELTTFEEMDVPQFLPDSDDEQQTQQQTVVSEVDLQQHVLDLKSRISTLQKQTRRPTFEIVESCKELLTILGIPYLQSDGESDVTLAELTAKGLIDGVISEDTDMLPYGCHTFITGFKDFSDTVTEYKLADVLSSLDMTREQFVDTCILCGCDYAEKIYKIGVKKGYELMKKYRCIEKIIEHIDSNPALKQRHPYPEDYMLGVNVARNMFLTRSPGTEPENVGRTLTQIREMNVQSQPFIWNFQGVPIKERTERLIQYLKAHNIKQSDWKNYCAMCEDWRQQKTMLDFFNKK